MQRWILSWPAWCVSLLTAPGYVVLGLMGYAIGYSLQIDMPDGQVMTLAFLACITAITHLTWGWAVATVNKPMTWSRLPAHVATVMLLYIPVLFTGLVITEVANFDLLNMHIDELGQSSSTFLFVTHPYIPITSAVVLAGVVIGQFSIQTKRVGIAQILVAFCAYVFLPGGIFYLQPKLHKLLNTNRGIALSDHFLDQ